MAVTIKNAIFWNAMSCCPCKDQYFGGTYRLHHQGEKNHSHVQPFDLTEYLALLLVHLVYLLNFFSSSPPSPPFPHPLALHGGSVDEGLLAAVVDAHSTLSGSDDMKSNTGRRHGDLGLKNWGKPRIASTRVEDIPEEIPVMNPSGLEVRGAIGWLLGGTQSHRTCNPLRHLFVGNAVGPDNTGLLGRCWHVSNPNRRRNMTSKSWLDGQEGTRRKPRPQTAFSVWTSGKGDVRGYKERCLW
jgi:hypothetical protein